jgi:hypothetical protein
MLFQNGKLVRVANQFGNAPAVPATSAFLSAQAAAGIAGN